MTVAVAFLCSDGVVIGVDSMITPNMGGISVGHHHGRKLEILPGSQIYAFAGDLGQAHRFRNLAAAHHAHLLQSVHPLDYPIALSQGVINQFASTGIAVGNIGVNTLLAFEHGGGPHCCIFEGPMQPRLLDQHHFYNASGSGKLSADPFLRFLTDIFCDGPPPVSKAVFLTTWVIQHVIDTNPGGVAGPIRIAVLERTGGVCQARELSETDVQEHIQAIESAHSALREWRSGFGSAEAAEGLPEPPEPPEPPQN